MEIGEGSKIKKIRHTQILVKKLMDVYDIGSQFMPQHLPCRDYKILVNKSVKIGINIGIKYSHKQETEART